MQTSIATVSLSGGLSEKLEAISAAKFDAVEIFENDLVTFNGTPSDVSRRSARASVWELSRCSRSAISKACRRTSVIEFSPAQNANLT